MWELQARRSHTNQMPKAESTIISSDAKTKQSMPTDTHLKADKHWLFIMLMSIFTHCKYSKILKEFLKMNRIQFIVKYYFYNKKKMKIC